MANVTVSSTIDTLLQSADAAEAKTAISAATAGSVSALSSNALVLAEKEWPIKTVTWATNQTLTYSGGTNTAGDGVIIQANVTTQFVLTVTPTSSTIYRNGAVTSLSGTITVPVGKHRFVFWTPDDGTTLYMEDTVFAAVDVPVAATPTNYTAATPDVEAHLAGIDTALASAGGGWATGILFTTGSTSPVIVSSIAETSVFSGTIPAGTFGTSGAIRFSFFGLYLNNTGSTGGINFKLQYGSDVIWADTGNSGWFGSSGTAHPFVITGEIRADGTLTLQKGYGSITISTAQSATTGYGDASGSTGSGSLGVTFGGSTTSVDSSSSQTLSFLMTLTGTAGASANHTVTVLSGMCWKL